MITRDLRHAIAAAVAAAGFPPASPGLRPTGTPGQYAASVALSLGAGRLGAGPREVAAALARTLAEAGWVAEAEVTGPGYLTVTVTPARLKAVAEDIALAGPGCVTSDALAGRAVPAPAAGDPLAAPSWEKARQAVAARLTARLAAAAGATVTGHADTERGRLTPDAQPLLAVGAGRTRCDDHLAATELARAVGYAGRDAVLFTLARAIPGKPVRVDPAVIARHVPGNPAYAVRYAHARAASGVRWAVNSRVGDPPYPPRATTGGTGSPAGGEPALLDALSWLPERVATAARRGRPDEFARYLEDLASVTVDVLSSAAHPGKAGAPGSDRLAVARAARTGLAAGLGLLEVAAPDRLLTKAWRVDSCEPCRPPGGATSWGRAARRPPAGAAGGPERA